jgi:hypothetical protein
MERAAVTRRVVVPDHVLWIGTGDDLVMLHGWRDEHRHLNATARWVVEIVAAGATTDEVVDVLCAVTDGTPEEVRAGVDAIVDELVAAGFLAVADDHP